MKFSFNDYIEVIAETRERAAEFFGFDPTITRVELFGIEERGMVWRVYPREGAAV